MSSIRLIAALCVTRRLRLRVPPPVGAKITRRTWPARRCRSMSPTGRRRRFRRATTPRRRACGEPAPRRMDQSAVRARLEGHDHGVDRLSVQRARKGAGRRHRARHRRPLDVGARRRGSGGGRRIHRRLARLHVAPARRAEPVELPRDSAGKLMAMVNSGERNRIISAVANYAMSLPHAEQRYGVIGYCWGGGTMFMHVVNGGVNGFAGGVAFYGLPYMNGAVPIRDSLAKIKVPVMLFNGSKDARIGAAMPAVDSAMKALGKSYVGTNYDGAVARVHALAGRSEGDARPRRRSGEPRGDEGRVAAHGRVPQAESRSAMKDDCELFSRRRCRRRAGDDGRWGIHHLNRAPFRDDAKSDRRPRARPDSDHSLVIVQRVRLRQRSATICTVHRPAGHRENPRRRPGS